MPELHVHLLHTPGPAMHDPDEGLISHLRQQLLPGVHVSAGEHVPPGTHVLISGRPRRDQLEAAPELKALIIPFAGLPEETRLLMQDFPQISVHNIHHNAPMTAEMALALLFSVARYLLPVDRIFRNHDWSPRYEGAPAVVLEGKTALILGYGAIGKRIGAVLAALGMNLLAIKRHVDAQTPTFIHPPTALHELLPQTHVLMVSLPGTPETTDMIGERELAVLPRGAIIVNTGRANIINQHALYAALKSGHLHGVGLDVWYNYPASVEARSNTPPADLPFHELDNIVMSPHRSGALNVAESEQRRMDALAENINQYMQTGVMPNRVDLETGY